MLAVLAHHDHLLIAARDQLFRCVLEPPVVEMEVDAVLRGGAQAHADRDLVEREQLGKVLTGATCRHEVQAVRKLFEQLGRVLAKKKLAASALPLEVVYVVDVSDEIGFFEADDMPVLVGSHRS